MFVSYNICLFSVAHSSSHRHPAPLIHLWRRARQQLYCIVLCSLKVQTTWCRRVAACWPVQIPSRYPERMSLFTLNNMRLICEYFIFHWLLDTWRVAEYITFVLFLSASASTDLWRYINVCCVISTTLYVSALWDVNLWVLYVWVLWVISNCEIL